MSEHHVSMPCCPLCSGQILPSTGEGSQPSLSGMLLSRSSKGNYAGCLSAPAEMTNRLGERQVEPAPFDWRLCLRPSILASGSRLLVLLLLLIIISTITIIEEIL